MAPKYTDTLPIEYDARTILPNNSSKSDCRRKEKHNVTAGIGHPWEGNWPCLLRENRKRLAHMTRARENYGHNRDTPIFLTTLTYFVQLARAPLIIIG